MVHHVCAAALLGPRGVLLAQPRLHVQEPGADDGGLDLHLWVLTTWAGEPRNLAPEEHDDLRWVTREDLPSLRLAHPSYRGFLDELLSPGRAPRPAP